MKMNTNPSSELFTENEEEFESEEEEENHWK